MAAFAASLTLSDTRLVVVPTVPVTNTLTTDTFDIRLGRAGTITGLTFDNMNNVNGSFKVSKVSASNVVTDIITVAAGAAAGIEIVTAATYAAFDTDYATTLAKRSFIATDFLRVTCLTANSAGVINIDVSFSRTPAILQ